MIFPAGSAGAALANVTSCSALVGEPLGPSAAFAAYDAAFTGAGFLIPEEAMHFDDGLRELL
jgi:hypothetical protein